MNVFDLENFRIHFISEVHFQMFVSSVNAALAEHGTVILVAGDDSLGVMSSPRQVVDEMVEILTKQFTSWKDQHHGREATPKDADHSGSVEATRQ